ncbi:DUF2267 domain-containing protein [Aurantiacibacter marinus]|uniref:DUF2267 domain-containing protein n=1 Tax=Aurantiacibacter marinus TaxID=874156 RepID=A0A0H0XK02_9SPHN|nr:DUF2267 domain-containing protein [Aurantiacibacter marinus]KLI62918.1 hypothetical protein AAV99_12715 [Aurantiacibacter marinus]
MSALGLRQFDKAVQDANIWLDDLMRALDWDDKARAFRLLRSTLHALRDRLPVAEAVDLSAQLPTLIRGVYFEGWTPRATPTNEKTAEDFADKIDGAFPEGLNIDPITLVEGALEVIASHVSEGEIDNVKGCLPPDIRSLWPRTMA